MTDVVLEARGVRYATHPDVYLPHDDSFLLLEAVLRLAPDRLLEVGTGTGLVAIAAARAGHRVVATDVNPHAVRTARANARRNHVPVEVVRADLLRGVRPERFGLIAFNPPYLPTEALEHVPGPLDAAFDGGPDGLSTVRRFLAQLGTAGPPGLVVASSLQPLEPLRDQVRSQALEARVVATRALPHERLHILRFAPATQKD